MILIIALPAAAALMLLAEPILVTLFYYGEVMTLRDMAMATLSLICFDTSTMSKPTLKISLTFKVKRI